MTNRKLNSDPVEVPVKAPGAFPVGGNDKDAYDAWFREQVNMGLADADDPHAEWLSQEEMKAKWARERADLIKRIGKDGD